MTEAAALAARAAIAELSEGRSLGEERAYALACSIMEGALSEAQIAGLLVALRMHGESESELLGFARALRDRATRLPVDGAGLVDTCGTGGDGKGTFNVSTVVAFVAAGGGAPIAKHGNRSVSSKCGSSQVLAALGIEVEAEAELAARQIAEHGLTFLFAPLYHSAARHAASARQAIGIRSVFNLVGPLCNPARADRQLLGVFDARYTEPLARVSRSLGSTHCLVVHGLDGLDEISIAAPTRVSELANGEVRTYEIDPREFGLERVDLESIAGGDAATNADIARSILAGAEGPARDIVLLNAGAALYVAGRADSIGAGIEAARRSIDSGAAMNKLEALAASSREALDRG